MLLIYFKKINHIEEADEKLIKNTKNEKHRR